MDATALRRAILHLDPICGSGWMAGGPDKGKPKLQRVRMIYFYAGNDNPREVTRADIDAAIPGYNQEIAYETWLRGGIVPPVGFTTAPRTENDREIIKIVLSDSGFPAGVDSYWVKTGKHAGKPRVGEIFLDRSPKDAVHCDYRNVTRREVDAAMPGYTRKHALAMAAANGRAIINPCW